MYVGKKKIDSPKLQYCVSCVCLDSGAPLKLSSTLLTLTWTPVGVLVATVCLDREYLDMAQFCISDISSFHNQCVSTIIVVSLVRILQDGFD